MLVGIEASRANRLQKTGVEWYAYHLIQKMKTLPEAVLHAWLLYSNAPLASGLEKGPSNWQEVRLSWPPKFLWTQLRLSYEMWRHPSDVLFVPAHVLPRVIPKRSVVTVHDIGFHRLPALYKLEQRYYHEWSTRDTVKRASRILTVSEFSKQELMEVYGAREEQVSVTPLGIDQERYKPMGKMQRDAILDRWQLPTPFVMFIGRLERKKNVLAIIQAFKRYKVEQGLGDPLHLVLVGQPGAGYEELERALTDTSIARFVHVVGYINEEEKLALLSSAEALIHPSWYEGFGLTPLEAMACGTPVICSHAASLPEVVGLENALWFDPADSEALAQTIARLMNDAELRLVLRERGLSWAKKYTWEATARQTLPLLTEWS